MSSAQPDDALPETPPVDAPWRTVQQWRVATRRQLRARREAIPRVHRERTGRFIRAVIEHHLPELDGACVGLYWPFRGELDLRELADVLAERARDFALPVVAAAGRPLLFRRWWPGMRMTRGTWDIPVPASGAEVHPDVLLIPLLGHDLAGYRLGHGGGYYDRTLSALSPRPLAVGVGYAAARLASIVPQPHDEPMDIVITDRAMIRFAGQHGLRAADIEHSWAPAIAGAER